MEWTPDAISNSDAHCDETNDRWLASQLPHFLAAYGFCLRFMLGVTRTFARSLANSSAFADRRREVRSNYKLQQSSEFRDRISEFQIKRCRIVFTLKVGEIQHVADILGKQGRERGRGGSVVLSP